MNLFSEFFLDGSSSFTSSRVEWLGRIFDPATPEASRDVSFTYTTTFGDVITGVVQYISTPANADFDASGRIDGATGLGISLNPNPSDRQYLATGRDEALNYPFRSPSSTGGTLPGGTIDYSFVTDRGCQLWVRPIATTEGFIVLDSNNHGAYVDTTGKFGMRYSNRDYPGTTSVVPNTWYHLMVVRAFGERGTGSVLYVNGIAEAAATGIYLGEDRPNDEMNPANQDNSPLVIGSSTSESPFGVGTQKYFRGIVDDLTMFVMGFNNSCPFGKSA